MSVLLVPGGPLLDPAYLPLELPGERVVVADLRYAPARRCDQLVDALEEVREARGFPVVDLVAHSAGANLVVRYLERFAHRVARVVLVTPSVFAVGLPVSAQTRLRTAGLSRGEPWFEDSFAALQRGGAARRCGRRRAGRPGRRGTVHRFRSRAGTRSGPRGRVRGRGGLRPAGHPGRAGRFRRGGAGGRRGVRRRRSPPVLREFAALLPHARFVELPRARHFPWRDDPSGFTEVLQEFLRPEEPEELPGGRDLGAVRIGRTVRKAAGRQTATVQALLADLHAQGFHRVPHPLGRDEDGREVWEHLAGDTVGTADPWPEWVFDEELLIDVGRWLREFHDASARFWSEGGEVLGHQDLAPGNAVVDGGRLVGFVDRDLLAASAPLRDLAFVALRRVPLTGPDGRTPAQRHDRLRSLLAAYGWEGSEQEVLDAVRVRAQDHADGLRQAALDGWGPAVELVAEGVADEFDRAAAGLAELL